MSEEALVDHIFVRLDPQVQDYVVVRSPKATAQLWEVMAKFEERYSCKKMQGSRNSDNVGRRGWNERRMSNDDDRPEFLKLWARPLGGVTTLQGGASILKGGNVEIDLTKTGLEESQKHELQDLFNSFKGLLLDKLVLTHVLYHEIDMVVGKPPVVSRPYRYDSDIVKTAFVTENGTFAFKRMPFGLLEAAPNFQKKTDIILKLEIGRFVSVNMNGVIISCPSFTHHVEHLREVFRLLQEAGLTLNKEKCKFDCDKLKYLGLIISKDGITMDEGNVKAMVEMRPPKNSKEVSKFLGMSQWYSKFIKNYADLCGPLYNLKKNFKSIFGQ
ncbi:retrovirus-related Pol polyprotein from transposon opus [Trichonephila clavipes]|nr:retrovirus-related Pol polyprotein from transposon opus [Trichonephila clavipes]